jgi:hypothetical protein
MENEQTNNITLDLGTLQKGKIKVHTEIINDLSSGIYSSPASCIKELVNNSYDAEAKLVTIRIKPIQDTITIIDDGYGMNAEEFDRNFAWISRSNKRNEGEVSPKLKRPLIGKIGIGFIAVNEICDKLEIISSKAGQSFKFTATIDFKKYFEEAIRDTDIEDEDGNEGIIKAEYELINEAEEKSEHYTIIRLLGLKQGVKKILDGQLHYSQLLKEKSKGYDRNFFKSMQELITFHAEENLRSYSDDNEYLKFVIDLASYIPVEYIDGGPIENCNDTIIKGIVNYHRRLNFKVDLDGIFLKKPISLPNKKDVSFEVISFSERIKVDEESNDILKFKGYFYAQNKILYPREINGISIKLQGIPIAPRYGYDTTFMQFPTYLQQLFMNWISGEIYVEEGLEDAMNIDRASFRLTHPHYLALQDFLHKYIHDKVIPLVYTLYNTGKANRDKKKAKVKSEDRKQILKAEKFEVKVLDDASNPVQLKKTSGKVVIEVDKAFSKKFKKKDWEYLEDIFLIFEMSYKESKGDILKMRELFYRKVAEWKSPD